MAKHTPGPWEINPRYPEFISTVANDADICEIDGWPPELWAEQKANRHLIAAAPDLLEALEGLETYLRQTPHHNAPEAAAARAAIRKAKGEAS